MYKLIFQNENFIIVDKESNVLTVPSRIGAKDERNCLGIILENDFKLRIFPVHRLDFEVSGLVMFALNEQAQRIANSWFEKKEVTKTYSATTTSSQNVTFPMNEILVWECMLMKGKKRAYEADFGKKSKTLAKLIEVKDQKYYRWELNPVTGRSHQLRYELFRHGHLILGDALYGSEEKYEKGIALRSFNLDFSKCPGRLELGLPTSINIF
jgi:tRNA pseudouridine32 synthase/23S rRNA pseudouridine746 synthase